MTIHNNCPRCDKRWDATEFPAQKCFGCGYPSEDIEQDAHDAVEGYAWWPRVDVSRFVARVAA